MPVTRTITVQQRQFNVCFRDICERFYPVLYEHFGLSPGAKVFVTCSGKIQHFWFRTTFPSALVNVKYNVTTGYMELTGDIFEFLDFDRSPLHKMLCHCRLALSIHGHLSN